MTAKQVQRLLKSRPLADSKSWRELDPQQERAYKKYEIAQIQALQHFIPRLRYDYQPNPDTGRPERCGYVLEIAMDEPLTPADRVALNAEIGVKDVPNANFGVETPACNPQFWRSGPLNAKIGAQPSGNLSVTGANAPGAADAATASASPAHSLEQVAADLSQTTADEAGTAKAEPQPCSPRTGQPTQPSTKTVDLDLPLAELRARALADLERVRGQSSQTAIVAQFIGRLLGLGRDAEGLLRSTPDRGAGDYARVGELCRDFGPAPVLTQVFAIAGRVPDDARDPLAYLRSSLEHKRRRRQRARQPSPTSATSETPDDPLDQLTFADYREVPSETGGGA
jgi:hypothetical protein